MSVVLAVVHHPTFGGPHNQLLRMSRRLLARGWETIVLLPEGPGNAAERLRAAGIRVFQVPLHRPRKSFSLKPHWDLVSGFLPEIATIRRVIRGVRADVVQVIGPMYPHAAFAARREGVPVVWQLLSTFAPLPIRCAMMPMVLYLSDVVMTTGMAIARAHPGVTRLGHRWVPFYPPVDTGVFRPDPHQRAIARKELEVPADAILVGTVGNFNWQKGHDLFVRTASHVQQRYPGVFFRLLGATTPSHISYYDKNVKKVAESLGLLRGGRLRFFEPGHRVAELLPAFDIFVMTSRAEGVPTTILEAMACGVPVIATDVGAVREVVENGITGRMVPPLDTKAAADAVLDLLQNPATRLAMGSAARARAVERYDTEVCVRTHHAAYALAQTTFPHRRSPSLVVDGSAKPLHPGEASSESGTGR
jgi:glycosyltransferase involved in cell wall biosynthesis